MANKMEKGGKRLALGRGLGALIPGAERTPTPAAPRSEPTQVAIDAIVANPWQPRRRFTDASIDELAASIREHGVVQPLVVRRVGERYELIAGERRWRASTKVGLKQVPVVVRDTDDDAMLEVALIENIQREDLNPIEEALAYRRLADDLRLTQEAIAERVGKERSTVANSLRLLNLPQEVQEMIELGQISAGHARAVSMAGSEAAIVALARKIVAQKLTVRQAEGLAKGSRKKPGDDRSPELRDLEDRLTRALGTKVRVTEKNATSGSLTIDYYSLDQFDALLRRFGA